MRIAGVEPGQAIARSAALTALFLALPASELRAQVEWRFDGVERVVAIADIHGAYGAFERILERAGLVDASLSWSGGASHLVIVGDVLDRGAESRRAMDLIRKLEIESLAAGGRVHMVLGNHEIMNLASDLRYVSPGEYGAFADEESPEVRARERARFVTLAGPDAIEGGIRFDEKFLPGFFGHRAAFSTDGEYGAWLLGKPVLVVINGTAFVHGGLTTAMIEHSGDLNLALMTEIRDLVAAHSHLVDSGLLSPTEDLYALPAYAEGLLQRDELSSSQRAAAERLADIGSLLSFAPDGPVWYRGNVGCSRLTEADRLGGALDALGADRLVIGHTPTPGAMVLSRMNDSLLRIDTGMLNSYYGGRASALVIDNGQLSVLYENETGSSLPQPQPRRVGVRPAGMSAETLESLLLGADFSLPEDFDSEATYVRVVDGDREFRALFTVAAAADRNGAVAAYRLDRLLGLDMVPVTVARTIGDVVGALQFWPDSSLNESERSSERLGSSAWCPLGEQFQDMYLFDALIFNTARSTDRIRYSMDNFQLMLVANDRSFLPERERPEYLATVPVELSSAWRDALEGLDEDGLTAALGDVLDRRRIRAILSRRDHLLEIAR